MGTGAVGSMACVAIALTANGKKDSQKFQNDNVSNIQLSELNSQKSQLEQSLNESTAKMEAVEIEINSLQTEHDQLLSVISNLNYQKEQLESESNSWNEKIYSQKQELEAVSSQFITSQRQKRRVREKYS